MKSNKILIVGYSATISILLAFYVLSFITTEKFLLLSDSSVRQLNDDWTVITDSKEDESANLPVNKSVAAGKTITIKKVLSEDFQSSRYLLLRSSLQELSVYLDDEKIYELDFKDDSILKIPAASLWNIVKIPDDSSGKTVSITLTSDFPKFSGVINPIVFGGVGDLNLYIIRNYASSFLIAVFIFFIGFVLFLLPLFIKTAHKSPLLFLGLFTITISLWFMAESRMMQFFTGSRIVLGSLAYMMLALVLLPLSIYVRELVSEKFKKIYAVFAVVLFLNFIAILLLQFSGLLPFYNSLVITNSLMLFWLLITIPLIAYEIFINKNKQAKNIFHSAVFLVIFAFVELVSFYVTRNTMVGNYLNIGVIIFIFLQALEFLKQVRKQNIKSIEADMLRDLAFKDYMTKGGNRLAFELEMEKVFSDKEKLNRTGLVYFDVDGLKRINDELGHMTGDEAIVFSCELINEVFGEYGNCYRIGGDEFAALLIFSQDNNIEQKINELIEIFNVKLEKNKEKYEFPLTISSGGIHFEAKLDKDIKNMMNRADKAMYSNKNRNRINNKNTNGITYLTDLKPETE